MATMRKRARNLLGVIVFFVEVPFCKVRYPAGNPFSVKGTGGRLIGGGLRTNRFRMNRSDTLQSLHHRLHIDVYDGGDVEREELGEH